MESNYDRSTATRDLRTGGGHGLCPNRPGLRGGLEVHRGGEPRSRATGAHLLVVHLRRTGAGRPSPMARVSRGPHLCPDPRLAHRTHNSAPVDRPADSLADYGDAGGGLFSGGSGGLCVADERCRDAALLPHPAYPYRIRRNFAGVPVGGRNIFPGIHHSEPVLPLS